MAIEIIINGGATVFYSVVKDFNNRFVQVFQTLGGEFFRSGSRPNTRIVQGFIGVDITQTRYYGLVEQHLLDSFIMMLDPLNEFIRADSKWFRAKFAEPGMILQFLPRNNAYPAEFTDIVETQVRLGKLHLEMKMLLVVRGIGID